MVMSARIVAMKLSSHRATNRRQRGAGSNSGSSGRGAGGGSVAFGGFASASFPNVATSEANPDARGAIGGLAFGGSGKSANGAAHAGIDCGSGSSSRTTIRNGGELGSSMVERDSTFGFSTAGGGGGRTGGAGVPADIFVPQLLQTTASFAR